MARSIAVRPPILFARGRDLKQVQLWLGHSNPSFTLRTYVHLLDDGLGDPGFWDEAVSVSAESATA